ncbi:hypothetical protein PG991_008314 [Apiospora marii]|uniref:Uncharacterized protein n=1 Tax=Apiospora marii TaxID=335849 RepID=A0ABR1RSN1_9PEZI
MLCKQIFRIGRIAIVYLYHYSLFAERHLPPTTGTAACSSLSLPPAWDRLNGGDNLCGGHRMTQRHVRNLQSVSFDTPLQKKTPNRGLDQGLIREKTAATLRKCSQAVHADKTSLSSPDSAPPGLGGPHCCVFTGSADVHLRDADLVDKGIGQ